MFSAGLEEAGVKSTLLLLAGTAQQANTAESKLRLLFSTAVLHRLTHVELGGTFSVSMSLFSREFYGKHGNLLDLEFMDCISSTFRNPELADEHSNCVFVDVPFLW